MNNFLQEYDQTLINTSEKITFADVWNNHPPVIHWCLGVTCLSFGFVYLLLITIL